MLRDYFRWLECGAFVVVVLKKCLRFYLNCGGGMIGDLTDVLGSCVRSREENLKC
jgi:hypothetical protein